MLTGFHARNLKGLAEVRTACATDEIRVMGRGSDGRVHVAELTAHPDAPRWLQRMRVGEFWSTVAQCLPSAERIARSGHACGIQAFVAAVQAELAPLLGLKREAP